jgi:hypothetical protein
MSTHLGTPRRVLTALTVAAALVVALAGCNDDGNDLSTQGATTTEAPAGTPAAPGTAAGGGELTPDELSTALWPFVDTDVRYGDPVDAATGFAVDYVGFVDPVVGEFQQGDSRSGEVEVRPQENGPVTTVFVRQLGTDDTWWVLGAATAEIVFTLPAVGSAIDTPLAVAGEALAFEGNVQVEVRGDGSVEPIGESFVTGGGDVMRPFTGTIEFQSPQGGWGAVMGFTLSAEDGRVWQATVFRVGFIGGD